jgi:hypothetical protein
MFVPLPLLVVVAALVVALATWTVTLARRRNPLPFPDPGSRIFSTASLQAKDALIEVLAAHGIYERFRADSAGVARSIFWDGTILNTPSPDVIAKLGQATSSIGLVAANPAQAAKAAADTLRARGFSAEIVTDVEPELPIVFLCTNAFTGAVLNFRKHMVHLPRPTPAPRRG